MKPKRLLLNTVKLTIKAIPRALGKLRQGLLTRLRFSITFKITTFYAIIFSLMLVFINLIICAAMTGYLGVNVAEDLDLHYQQVASYLEDNQDIPIAEINQLAELSQIEITLFDASQQVLYTTNQNSFPIFYDQANRYNAINITDNYFLELGINNQLVLNDSYLQIASPLDQEIIFIGLLAAVLFSMAPIAIIIVMIIGWKTSKKMLRPVATMTKTAQNITINALETRLDVSSSHDELKDLAETFNSMLDRIQVAYEQQNQFVSDASHELRTPIAVIQGYANLLARWGKDDPAVLAESIESLRTEAENMKELVEKLLFLARGDKNSQPLDKKEFPLYQLVEEVVKETKLIDADHEITLQNCQQLMINADRKLLKEALRILVDNSIKYTPLGGKITISCYSQNSRAVLTVADNGSGIPAADLPHVFNRFYRADKSRTKQTGGTGLGLAIAKWIIHQHGGTIKVESQLNEGTKVIVCI